MAFWDSEMPSSQPQRCAEVLHHSCLVSGVTSLYCNAQFDWEQQSQAYSKQSCRCLMQRCLSDCSFRWRQICWIIHTLSFSGAFSHSADLLNDMSHEATLFGAFWMLNVASIACAGYSSAEYDIQGVWPLGRRPEHKGAGQSGGMGDRPCHRVCSGEHSAARPHVCGARR